MSDCIFCGIAKGTLDAEKIYEDEQILAFKDLYPKATVHILVIPKMHITSLADLEPTHKDLLAHLTLMLPKIAKQCGLDTGFRTVVNTGKGGGQEVFHLHYHILGGESLPSF